VKSAGAGAQAGKPPAVRFTRALGVPALIAIGLSSVGASLYFGMGVVAGNALGLAPVAYLLAGIFFVVTGMTYAEASSLHPERGGSSVFARYAGNEMWSFVAGWAIILDYLIVMAICVAATAHYLTAFTVDAGTRAGEIVVAVAVIGFVAWSNIRGLSADRLFRLLRAGLVSLGLLAVIIVYGAATIWNPAAILDSIHLGTAPTIGDLIFAAVVAAVAVIGIESASGLAGEVRAGKFGLRRVILLFAAIVPTLMVGISVIALMALPAYGGATPLESVFVDAPLLGVVSVFEPELARALFTAAVGIVAVTVLILAANGNMLGLSRLGYSLATNRQIPSAVGRLHPQRSTPYVLVSIAAVLVFCLTLVSDTQFLVGLFAFGAMLAFTIAHVSVIVLRFREPDRPSPYRMPLSIPLGKGSLPIPAVLGAGMGLAAWVSVLWLHEGARWAGLGWMAFGILMFVVYRKSQGKSLTRRFVISEQSLKDEPDLEYGSILVPVFGDKLDDDIIGTAGRLAAEEADDGQEVTIEAIYVLLVPMSLPIDARIPQERIDEARRALRRAREVGEEYDGVKVETAPIRGRTVGQVVVSEAKRKGAEAIVLAAEEVSRTRGGSLLGGRGGPRDRGYGEVTRYVVEKAPCRVILTAAPTGEEGVLDAVAPD
jgi:APA family basic amino acid/polyamine antiporter